MSDFIEKGFLLRTLSDNQFANAAVEKADAFIFWQKVREYMEKFPTSNVRLVLKSEWTKNSVGKPICKLCGGEQLCNHGGKYRKSNFCPHCGADLRGDS